MPSVPPISLPTPLSSGPTPNRKLLPCTRSFVEFLKSGWSPDESALASLLKASSRLPDRARLSRPLSGAPYSGFSHNHVFDSRPPRRSPPSVRPSLVSLRRRCTHVEFHHVGLCLPCRYRECFVLFVAVLGVAQPL
ncbi:hypothetical protein ACMD2_25993 [Ananas comosus]|uniref:Uncharacterized protein n=1 Tax=Ananas comosus TaxID=4615 RepID=A0A199V1S0_ANACO|nr:hypothetical protein ACMD2_25993 [Ananas comosus]